MRLQPPYRALVLLLAGVSVLAAYVWLTARLWPALQPWLGWQLATIAFAGLVAGSITFGLLRPWLRRPAPDGIQPLAAPAFNQRLPGILGAMTDGHFAVDDSLRLLEAGPPEDLNLLAGPAAGQIGQDLALALVTTEPPLLPELQRAAQAGAPAHLEASLAEAQAWVEVYFYPSPGRTDVFWRDISRRRRSEATLRQSQADLGRRVAEQAVQLEAARRETQQAQTSAQAAQTHFSNLLNAIAGIVWEGEVQPFRFTFVSRQVEAVLGYPTAQWLGDPEFWADHIHPDDRAVTRQAYLQAAAQPRPVELEYRMLAADGRVVYLHDVITVVREASVPLKLAGNMLDITQRRLSEQDEARIREDDRRRLAELARTNNLLTALSPVAARLTATPDADEVLATLGAELAKLGINCIVALLRASDDTLVIHFGSIRSRALASAEKLLGFTLRGFSLPREKLPEVYAQVIASRQPHFDAAPYERALEVLPGFARPLLQQVFDVLDMSSSARSVTVPLTVESQVIGALIMWGSEVQPGDVRPFSIFGDQVALALARTQQLAAERQRRHEAETLRAANFSLTQTLELERVLDDLLERLGQLIPYDSANVMLFDGDDVIIRALRGYEPHAEQWLGQRLEQDRLPPGLRDVLIAGQPQVVADLHTLPDRAAWPASDHSASWLGVPLVAGGNVIGLYSIEKTAPAYFGRHHTDLALALAGHAAIAIQNARLFEQVSMGRERLQILSQRLVEVQEAERRFLARELHDEIGQVLTSLRLSLHAIGELPDEGARKRLADARSQIQDLLGRVRQLSLDLRPAILDNLGLVPALRWQIDRFVAQTQVQIDFRHTEKVERRFATQVETAAFRIVQEALTNIARHAGVSRGEVVVWATEETLTLEIEDQGQGFDPEAVLSIGQSSGLTGMRERASLLGGVFTINSARGSGTTVRAELPLAMPLERRHERRTGSLS
jgi:PAS domain S-box-containing protein